jgi:PST family polysaccharide transporter
LKPFDANGDFRSAVDGGIAQRLAVRGAGVTVLSSGGGLAIQIVSTVVLARLLTPADFGLVAMVTTFSLLLVNFGLNGFTEAVLQHEKINHSLVSNLFWINISAGILLTIGFAAAGSLLARFYNNPLVAHVAVGVSLTIIATSASVLHLALLKRAMRFSVVSLNAILAQTISILLSIILAWKGWGYRALVAGAVTQAIFQSIGAWSLCRWIPGFPRRVAGTGSMVRFAMHVYARFTINYLSRNVDNLLVGWRFGVFSLGFYKKAYDLFALSASQLTSPLTNVALSALSRFKSQSIQYRNLLLSALGVIALTGMGLSAEFALIGKDLIRLLLGPGWESAGQIFIFFAPGIGIMMVYYVHGWIHLSIGRPDRWFRWGLIEIAVTCLLFLLMLRWGPVGIAIAWTSSFWILTIPAFWYAGRPIRLGVGPVLAAIWRPLVASLLAGSASAAGVRRLPSFGTLPGSAAALARIVEISLLFGGLYVGANILLHGGCGPFYQLARLLREMISLRKPLTADVAAGDSGKTKPDGLRSASSETPLPTECLVVEATGEPGAGRN